MCAASDRAGPTSPSVPSTPTSSPEFKSVIIVGAGAFGAATAYTLASRGIQVALVDTAQFPSPRAASHDIAKIVRDDYPDLLYMRMMAKAMPKWRNHALYKEWYHETGMLRADPTNFGERSLAAYQILGIKSQSEILSVGSIRKRWNGVLATADFEGASSILYNPATGFAEADKALAAVVQAAIDHGVQYTVGEMEKLVFDANRECTGVALKCGQMLTADRVLMCTGAWTEPLLVQSNPDDKNLHANGRLVAMGALSFYATLQGAQRHKFEQIPVLKNCLPHVMGEGMSMLQDGTAKFNCDMCFTNYVDFAAIGKQMSIPPVDGQYNMWTGVKVAQFFQEKAKNALRGLYGQEIDKTFIKGYRLCW
ncbi:hypothetical protein ARSEF1564_008461 [Beauveria bassiana]